MLNNNLSSKRTNDLPRICIIIIAGWDVDSGASNDLMHLCQGVGFHPLLFQPLWVRVVDDVAHSCIDVAEIVVIVVIVVIQCIAYICIPYSPIFF